MLIHLYINLPGGSISDALSNMMTNKREIEASAWGWFGGLCVFVCICVCGSGVEGVMGVMRCWVVVLLIL